MWEIAGWRRLTVRDDPPLVAAREEFLAWLAEVSAPYNADLNARLRSELDSAHLSARLELFVHHYFRSNGWETQIHPQMADTSNRPDFQVKEEKATLCVECKSVLDQTPIAQQDQRLRRLADSAGKKLQRAIILHRLSDLPPSIPTRRIIFWLQRQQIPEDSPDLLEFDFWDDHQGCHYGLRAILPKLNEGGEVLTGVHGLMSQATTVTNARQLRVALQEKASKYGTLHMPYMIAISGETDSPLTTMDELDALFGDRVWNIPQRSAATATETRNTKGLFNLRRNAVPEYRDVSVVLVYRFKWLDNAHEHRVHIYHNPHALRPLSPDLFPEVPQLLLRDGGNLKWINSEPGSA